LPELQGDPEWDVIIAHFLGVDHIGHTYSAHNEIMNRKLKQLDDELEVGMMLLLHYGSLLPK
jgi:predicted AlkP superfamily pyrophosphatase or phosphodiesterase